LQILEVAFCGLDPLVSSKLLAKRLIEGVFTSLGAVEIVHSPLVEVVNHTRLEVILEIKQDRFGWLITFTLIPTCNRLVVSASCNGVLIHDIPCLAVLVAAQAMILAVLVPSYFALIVTAMICVADIVGITFPTERTFGCAIEQMLNL
jgi:hypothetical protein